MLYMGKVGGLLVIELRCYVSGPVWAAEEEGEVIGGESLGCLGLILCVGGRQVKDGR